MEPIVIEKPSKFETNEGNAFNQSMNSMFVEVDYDGSFNDSNEMCWVPSVEPADSKESVTPNGGTHRQSVVMNPVPGFGGLLGADFDDNDYDDSDDDVPPKPKQGVAAGNSDPNHRPMVGGFAAAAYEAARADHYRQKGIGDKKPFSEGKGEAPFI